MNDIQRLFRVSGYYVEHLERLKTARDRFLSGELNLNYSELSAELEATEAAWYAVWRLLLSN